MADCVGLAPTSENRIWQLLATVQGILPVKLTIVTVEIMVKVMVTPLNKSYQTE